jgi:disulfide bond formation protein DsbB
MKGFSALCTAWLVACLSVCCSLYFSEGFKLDSCNLCWIQRMCMYPLALILGMAVYNSCYTIIPYVMPQLCIGCCAACYQIAMQSNLFPDFLSLCQTGPSCLESMDIGMGFVSLPMLTVCACCAMMCCLFYAWRQSQQDSQPVYIKIK